MSVMTYKGFSARIEFDPDDMIFAGRVAGINDVIGFHAESVGDLKDAFEEAVDDYIETCAATGKQPEKPYSGNVNLRIAPQLHAKIALRAQLEGKSLNQLGEEILERAFT